MLHKRWTKLSFALILCAGSICLVGCSEPARSGTDTEWVQNDSLSAFEENADSPPTAKTLWAIADILATQGRDKECQYVLKRIINENPGFMPAYNSLAELQMRQGQTNMAIQTLQDGLRADPQDPVLLNNLGMCWVVRRDNELALEMFTRAAGIVPENRKYRANMAVVLGLMGRDEEALSLFNQVLPVDLANQNLAVLQNTQEDEEPTWSHLMP